MRRVRIYLDPDRSLPGRLGDLCAGQASAGRCRLPSAATRSLARAGALHLTVSGHARTNCADHVNESGAQDQYAAPDRRSDSITLLVSAAIPVGHQPHLALDVEGSAPCE